MKKINFLIITGLLAVLFTACEKTDYKAVVENFKAEQDARYAELLAELKIELCNNENEQEQPKKEYEINEPDSLPCITEFLYSEILPLGAIVTVKDETGFYITPNEYFDKYDFNLLPGDKLYVTYFGMNNDNTFRYGRTDGHYNCENLWVKVCNENGVEGWTLAKNLFVVRMPESNPSFKKNFSVYGFSRAAFSPDAKKIAMKEWRAHSFGPLYVVDVESAKAIETVQNDDGESSEDVCCFSSDGNLVFYESDLCLKSFNINERRTSNYGTFLLEYASVSDIKLSKDGKQIGITFSANNNWGVEAVVYDLKKDMSNGLSRSEWLKYKRDFYSEYEDGFPTKKSFWQVTAADSYHGFAAVPEKDLVLYCVSRDDNILSGIYFFRLSTMELLKIENPLYYYWNKEEDRYREIYNFRDIVISNDRTKAAIIAYGKDTRITSATVYVCDLNLDEVAALPGKSSIYAEGIDTYEKIEAEKAKLYINNEVFFSKDVFSLGFSNDDYYTASPGRHDGSYRGTYYITYSPEGCVLHLSDIFTNSEMNYYEREFNDRIYPKICTIKPEEANFDNIGLLYNERCDDYDYMGYWSGRLSPAGQVYTYKGEDVIKYPKDPDNLDASYYTTANVKMRESPDINANTVSIPFLNDDFQSSTERTIIYKDTRINAFAETVKQDTIDGITAPWILTEVHDDRDDWAECHYVWVFGGYVREGRIEK